MKVLVTCPPMLGLIDAFEQDCQQLGLQLQCPNVVQTLSESELMDLVPHVDGWIIGDDPATRAVLQAGVRGQLRAAVKWGIGIDNVDLQAAREIGLPITNTPCMFGKEVADLAMSYVVALARQTFEIDRGVRAGTWPKPRGISLADRVIGIVGLGDIGSQLVRRARAADMCVIGYDPAVRTVPTDSGVQLEQWPTGLEKCDFLVFACSLTPMNRHMLNADTCANLKPGVRIVNVSRGPLIDESALLDALSTGRVFAAALDVFETEPLPVSSKLRLAERCIFGSHNASNTHEGVVRASRHALSLLASMLSERLAVTQ